MNNLSLNQLVISDNGEVISALNEAKELSVPQEVFGKGECGVPIEALYISDLHIPQHLKEQGISISDKQRVRRYIDSIIKRLISSTSINILLRRGTTPDNEKDLLYGYYYLIKKKYPDKSKDEMEVILNELEREGDIPVTPNLMHAVFFIGDISSEISLLDIFFERFNMHFNYAAYKSWKAEKGYVKYKREKKEDDEIEKIYKRKLNIIDSEIASYESRIDKIEKLTQKKNLYKYYEKKDNYDIKRLIEARKDIPSYTAYLIIRLKHLLKKRESLVSLKEDFFEEYRQSIEESFRCEMRSHCPFYFVMGNHEYSSYKTVDEACREYRKVLKKYDVVLLQNEIVEFDNCVIVGGSGFAKYNSLYNADTLIGSQDMIKNRVLEAKETDKFYATYQQALKRAKATNKPLIVLSHYPVKDWLSETPDEIGYYFHGHNHQNSITVNTKCHIYADNQIGYKSEEIIFRIIKLGTCYNPFINYEDGYYEISTKEYFDFYNYNGEYVKTGLIEKYISKGDVLYLIKRNGFFGFFLIGKNAKICYGGRAKKIGQITDIRYYYMVFCAMIYQYLRAMLPYRKFQEKISEEIKRLNIPAYNTGTIHGCIVDIDYNHHVMINPLDGTITFYYSPIFGIIQKFATFSELIDSVKDKYVGRLDITSNALLGYQSTDVLVNASSQIDEYIQDNELYTINIKDSVYSYSRKIQQLQRLFTSNILQDWNNDLVSDYYQIEDVESKLLNKKPLSAYNLVQKHWKNLANISTGDITVAMVKQALNPDRKCYFPYLDVERSLGRNYVSNKMSEVDIRAYIRHIPENILIETFEDFYNLLGMEILKYFPLSLISEDNYRLIANDYGVNNRTIIGIAMELPAEERTAAFYRAIAQMISLKNKPVYCSKELWNCIIEARDKK